MDSEDQNDGGVALVEAPAPVVEAVAEPVPAAEPEPAPAPKPRVADPLINTITGLRSKNREMEAENERLRREAADAKALADRLSKGDKTEPAPQPTRQPAPDDAEIDRRAEYKLFLRDVEGVRSRGMQEFGPQFNDTIRALGAVGADTDQFVQQVMAVDPEQAHLLLNSLAQDLGATAELVNMDPARRVAKLTRMAMAATAKTDPAPAPAAIPPTAPSPPAARTSRAPAPAPIITPSAAKTIDWRDDKASDAEFSRGWDEHMKQRHARR